MNSLLLDDFDSAVPGTAEGGVIAADVLPGAEAPGGEGTTSAVTRLAGLRRLSVLRPSGWSVQHHRAPISDEVLHYGPIGR